MIDYEKIRQIHKNTVRVVRDAGIVPNNSTFVYISNGMFVKKGTPYHIHYTNDFEEYYMTGGSHSITSRLIRKIMDKSDYQKYTENYGKNYVRLEPQKIKGVPTTQDYVKGYFMRFFALKVESTDPPIEVDSDFGSPLYEIYSLKWTINGKRQAVGRTNVAAREALIERNERLKGIASNYLEYFIEPTKTEFEKTLDSLGASNWTRDSNGNLVKPVAGEAPVSEDVTENETPAPSPPAPTNLPSGFNAGSGPPPGFNPGGGGGGY